MRQANSLADIELQEKQQGERHVVLILLVKPSDGAGRELLNQLNYFYHLSRKYCSVYAAGFAKPDQMLLYADRIKITSVNGSDWWYSDDCFLQVVEQLERRVSSWRYTGESQLLILQTNPEGRNVLNFQNYIGLDMAHGIRKGYIESAPRLLTGLINASKKEVSAVAALKQANRRIQLKKVAEAGLESCKAISKPLSKLLKDRIFYTTAIKKQK